MGVEVYDKYFRTFALNQKESKLRVLSKLFPSIREYSSEQYWNFQYLFQEKLAKQGDVIVNESGEGNKCLVIVEGTSLA
jgi:hypothetical protein